MKLYFLPLILSLGLLPVSQPLFRTAPVAPNSSLACDDVPELNKQIITYVNSHMSKTVGRGECWDLAAGALNTTHAKWDKAFKYGKEVDAKKDCIYPGDLMQFDNIVVEYTQGNTKFKEKMAQHTAIVYEVKGTGDFVMADQNTSVHGRKVGLSPLNLNNITKGSYKIYRPVME